MAEELSATTARIQEIATKLTEGDESALEDILSELGPVLATSLRRRFSSVLSFEDIDDVLSQMLYQIWKHRHTYQAHLAPFPVWCYVIARNIAQDVVQAKYKQKEVLSELWVELRKRTELSDGQPLNPALPVLKQILVEIHPVDRYILFESISGQESWAAKLAPELGLSSSNVRQRRFRALAKLRVEMGRRGFAVKPADS